jgi:hypothetical protein
LNLQLMIGSIRVINWSFFLAQLIPIVPFFHAEKSTCKR